MLPTRRWVSLSMYQPLPEVEFKAVSLSSYAIFHKKSQMQKIAENMSLRPIPSGGESGRL